MVLLNLILPLLWLIQFGCSENPDDAFPSYLRGMDWVKVREFEKQDLRLSDKVVPYNYAIDLSVNVRGHEGAMKSDFNGTVSISLRFIGSVNQIELHSNGLIIEKASFLERLVLSNSVRVVGVSTNIDRETITIHTNRTIQANEEFLLQITYKGLAKMDENGLYENWDPKLNKSLDTNGPFVLATRNFPTGARYWFPCINEPERNATFELQVNHPSGLSAYSNTEVKKSESIGNGRKLTVFEKTRSMPTYQLALSVNHLSVTTLNVKGLKNVRLIRSKNALAIPPPYLMEEDENEDRWKLDIMKNFTVFLEWRLAKLDKLILREISKEKLDIIVLEGSDTHSFRPGLITLGGLSIFKFHFSANLTHLLTRSLINTRHSTHLWLNDMLGSALHKEVDYWTSNYDTLPDEVLFSSLHERPLREIIVHSTSTKQYLASQMRVPTLKAMNILKMIAHMCPGYEKIIQDYIAKKIGGYPDIDEFIDTVSKSCPDSIIVKEVLEDYISKPGKALLIVRREGTTVTFKQTRYHSTYFDRDLRDNKTRYTIPIFFEIDGKPGLKVFYKNEESVAITVPETALFLINHELDHLYFVFYENIVIPHRNFTEIERKKLVPALQKSMFSAVNIGFVNFKEILQQLTTYTEARVFTKFGELHILQDHAERLVQRRKSSSKYFPYNDTGVADLCARMLAEWHRPEVEKYRTTWADMFNNETEFWEEGFTYRYRDKGINDDIHCAKEWFNASAYLSFFEENFLGDNTIIRPLHMDKLIMRSGVYRYHWMELHQFFFRNAGNVSNHRFDLLANIVLNHPTVDERDYPAREIFDDYRTELRNFVLHNPQRASSMATEIEVKLEMEYVKENMPKFYNEDHDSIQKKFEELFQLRKELNG